MYSIRFLSEAADDLEQIIEWYENKEPGLGRRFEANVFVAAERLQSNIVIYRPLFRGLSRIFVKRYPYVVYFKKYHHAIVIYAILHMKQSKSHLNKRL